MFPSGHLPRKNRMIHQWEVLVATALNTEMKALTANKHLTRWVEKMAELTQPMSIHWVDGSEAENE
jgi:GTP-dependent phosphoenolpyruvate carboxykinase